MSVLESFTVGLERLNPSDEGEQFFSASKIGLPAKARGGQGSKTDCLIVFDGVFAEPHRRRRKGGRMIDWLLDFLIGALSRAVFALTAIKAARTRRQELRKWREKT